MAPLSFSLNINTFKLREEVMETDREETIMYLRKIFHYLGENCKQLNSIKMIFM